MPKILQVCLATALVAAAVSAQAQKAPGAAKKLYCWDENGARVCSDALPAEAVGRARQEFSARSGLRTAEVQRALTEEERANAEADVQRQALDAAAAETRRRTEQAMLASYGSEEELRRVFNERTGIVDNNVKTAGYNVASLRDGLATLLDAAAARELSGKPVPPQAAADIQTRHAQLQRQLRMQADFERRRKELDAEIAETLQRYRELKGIAAAPASGVETPVQ
ncbi:MAG: hypothetical protein QM761_15030 [Pseudoxanthomonas sp.]